MDFIGYKNGKEVSNIRIMSIGGGRLSIVNHPNAEAVELYPQKSFAEIAAYCADNSRNLAEFVCSYEGDSIKDKLASRWKTMQAAVERGLVGKIPI